MTRHDLEQDDQAQTVEEQETRACFKRPHWIAEHWKPLPDTWPDYILSRLRRNGIETWEQLAELTQETFRSWPGCDLRRLGEFMDLVRATGRTRCTVYLKPGEEQEGPLMVMPAHVIREGGVFRQGVYFIRCEGFIKIGLAGNVTRRLNDFKLSNPLILEPLGWLPIKGDKNVIAKEAELHRQFANLRHRGEWFKDDPSLRAFIAEHATPWPEKP